MKGCLKRCLKRCLERPKGKAVLKDINKERPVLCFSATNKGTHSRRKVSDKFAQLPPRTWLAVGLQVRLTCNLGAAPKLAKGKVTMH